MKLHRQPVGRRGEDGPQTGRPAHRIGARQGEQGLVLGEGREHADGIIEPARFEAHPLGDPPDGRGQGGLVVAGPDQGVDMLRGPAPRELQPQSPAAVDGEFDELSVIGQVGP
jgi:hypothetical protein